MTFNAVFLSWNILAIRGIGNVLSIYGARGYYYGSAGHLSEYAVKQYILNQDGKDVFDYNIFVDHTG